MIVVPRWTRLRMVLLISCVLALCLLFAGARPNVVRRWNIFASATGGPSDPYTIFLGPFPTDFSCQTEARIIVRSGGHAFCRGTVAVDFGDREQALLWNEFWPSARWIAICEARLVPHYQPTTACRTASRDTVASEVCQYRTPHRARDDS